MESSAKKKDKQEKSNTNSKKEVKQGKTIMLKEPEIMYCQSTMLNMSKEEAILSFVSGEVAASRFAYSYPHLKRLKNMLEKHLKQYEKKHGKIDETSDTSSIIE